MSTRTHSGSATYTVARAMTPAQLVDLDSELEPNGLPSLMFEDLGNQERFVITGEKGELEVMLRAALRQLEEVDG